MKKAGQLCFEKVFYSLAANLQLIQNVPQPLPGHEIHFDQERDEKSFLIATS